MILINLMYFTFALDILVTSLTEVGQDNKGKHPFKMCYLINSA